MVDSRDQDLAPAVLRRVMGAPVPVDAPVALEWRRDALGAGREGVAVEEGEVGGDEIGAVRHLDREDGGEVVLVGGDEGQEVVPGGGAADTVGAPGGVGGQGLAQDLEHALELTREGGQVVDGQGEGPGCFAPGLLNNSIVSVCFTKKDR